ncbi:MAG TPA: ABC transporter permease, partial [Oscillospiraceae bacterium]|nr:ABC transporter permease [Oscillospiraceae bacterium]
GGEAPQFISFHERVSGEELALPNDGVLITEKLSEKLGLSIGDSITFTADGKQITAPVSGITENYVLHFIYMTKTCWERYAGETMEPNAVLTIMSDSGEEAQNTLASELIQKDAVLALTFSRDSKASFADTVGNLNYVVALIILSAAMLALTVLYNLTNINITERTREIATIKVLGFYDRETSAYVFRESLLLSLIGDAAGLWLGVYLHRFVISVAETDTVMFGRDLPAWCFFAAFATTMLFTFLVDWIMYFRLKKISMVESMKSVE